MLAMVLSSTTISWASEMSTSAQRRRLCSAGVTSGATAAVSVMGFLRCGEVQQGVWSEGWSADADRLRPGG